MAVPWKQLLQWAPQIIDLSRELLNLQRRRRATQPAQTADAAELAPRVAALEENERRQAELVDRMAQQQAELSAAVVSLHRRQRALIGAVVLLTVALLWLIFRH